MLITTILTSPVLIHGYRYCCVEYLFSVIAGPECAFVITAPFHLAILPETNLLIFLIVIPKFIHTCRTFAMFCVPILTEMVLFLMWK